MNPFASMSDEDLALVEHSDVLEMAWAQAPAYVNQSLLSRIVEFEHELERLEWALVEEQQRRWPGFGKSDEPSSHESGWL